jgi:hypothetical protein
MYDIILKDGLFWITYKGKVVEELGGFIEPISLERIIEEIKYEI